MLVFFTLTWLCVLAPRRSKDLLFPILLYLFVQYSYGQYKRVREEIDKYEGGLEVFSRGYEKMGFTRRYFIFHYQWIHLSSLFFKLKFLIFDVDGSYSGACNAQLFLSFDYE